MFSIFVESNKKMDWTKLIFIIVTNQQGSLPVSDKVIFEPKIKDAKTQEQDKNSQKKHT